MPGGKSSKKPQLAQSETADTTIRRYIETQALFEK
jgi:hypothetical protein